MKTFQLIPAFQNAEELQQIVDLVRQCVDPVKIILIGKYAGMELASVMGGYELLVVTRSVPKISALAVQHFVDKNFLPSARREKRLFIYLFPFDHIVGRHHVNYFFNQVNQHSYLLYADNNSNMWKRRGFKNSRVLRLALQDKSRCLELGHAFLREAERELEAKSYRVTAFNLYQSLRQFLSGIALVYYGFESHEENSLLSGYSLARHTSVKLSKLWDINTLPGRIALNKIHAFNHSSRFAHNFVVPAGKLAEYIGIMKIVEEEAERVCQQRIDLLSVLPVK